MTTVTSEQQRPRFLFAVRELLRLRSREERGVALSRGRMCFFLGASPTGECV